MPGWTLLDTHPTQGRTFQRPLDHNELVFLWCGLFNGSGDSSQQAELRLVNARDAHLFSDANITRAWLSTKRRYPLVGATVRGHNAPLRLKTAIDSKAEDGGGDNGTGFTSQPHFVVREHDLAVLHPREIIFGEANGAEGVQQQIDAIFNGPCPLSEDMLVQLYIFREADSKRTDVLHVAALMAHSIIDRLAGDTLIRCFLDTLARGGGPNSEPAQVPLEDRLAMAIPFAELAPTHLRSLSPPIRRWRMAVGAVIGQLRRGKLLGVGHSLPCRVTRSTPYTAARSGYVFNLFTHAQTAAIFANCRLHNVTFGSAYLTLAQVAMTRVLYRRYLRGEISEEEWAYRRRQPHLILGPINLRPYLDKTWFDRGGGGEFMMSANAFYYQLPSMALGSTAERHEGNRERTGGTVPFSELLSFDRFLHRASLIKKQSTASFSHPLLFETVIAGSVSRIAPVRGGVLQWMKRVEAGGDNGMYSNPNEEALSIMDMPMVWAFKGTSYGNLDSTIPFEYPIPPTHPLSPDSSVPYPLRTGYITPPPSSSPSTSKAEATPKIVVESVMTGLHVGPAELYPGASAFRGRLKVFVNYDRNVFEDDVVREWLDDISGAVLWYLGRTHPESRLARQRGGGDNGQAASVGEDVRAKL